MEYELKQVHIGQEIKKKLEEKGMTKSEFGRLISVPQQHVNRILERDTMETKKLYKVCEVLEFNFFALFCKIPAGISAYLSAVSTQGDAKNFIGDAALAMQLEIREKELEVLKSTKSDHDDRIEQYKSQLQDKDEIISMLKEQIRQLNIKQ
jgi:transcriptional regulator with XRE-family HTH domain